MHVKRVFSSLGAQIALGVLLAQVAVFYAIQRNEIAFGDASLAAVPNRFGDWRQAGGEMSIDKEVLDVLKADQVLNRSYFDPSSGYQASLFVAFFKTQRAGVSPHSPKVCLPGAGWEPRDSRTISIQAPGFEAPVPVNRYIIARGESRSLVLYWYQSFNRVVASEYQAKLYLMADSVRYRRSDTALVRVILPLAPGQDEAEAERAGVRFIQSFFAPLRSHLPA